jgi:hypothetical protein
LVRHYAANNAELSTYKFSVIALSRSGVSTDARTFIAAATALYLAGETDPAVLLNAGIAAVIPVVIRFVNKKDPAYGVVAAKVLTAAASELEKKTVKKKAAPKKK